MLLSDLINQHDFTSGFSETVENNRSGNSNKKEHIQQDECNNKGIAPL